MLSIMAVKGVQKFTFLDQFLHFVEMSLHPVFQRLLSVPNVDLVANFTSNLIDDATFLQFLLNTQVPLHREAALQLQSLPTKSLEAIPSHSLVTRSPWNDSARFENR